MTESKLQEHRNELIKEKFKLIDDTLKLKKLNRRKLLIKRFVINLYKTLIKNRNNIHPSHW